MIPLKKTLNFLTTLSIGVGLISISACGNNPQKQARVVTPKPIKTALKTTSSPPTSTTASTPSSTSSTPAWRRPASHTMTRGSDDAIFYAAKKNDMTRIKEILAKGTSVDHRNFNGETVLHIAASQGDLSLVKYLVSQGASVNAPTSKKWLPIHHAIRFDHPDVANYLIARKASLSAKTSDGMTALDLAKASKNPQIHAIYEKYKR